MPNFWKYPVIWSALQRCLRAVSICFVSLCCITMHVQASTIENILINNAACGNDDGSIEIVTTVFNPNNEYAIESPNFPLTPYQSSPIFTDLPSGDYLVRLLDSTGSCSDLKSINIFNISAPDEPTIACPASIELLCDIPDPITEVMSWSTGAMAVDFRDYSLDIDFITDLSTLDFTECGANLTIELATVDVCGTTNSCQSTIDIIDMTAPTITCPPQLSVDAGNPDYTDEIEEWLEIDNLVTDNCSRINPTNDLDESRIIYLCDDTFTIDVNFTAEDICNNSTSCMSSIFVQNELNPTVNCEEGLMVECGADPEEVLDELLIQFEDLNSFDEEISVVEESANIDDLIGLECGDSFILEYDVVDGCLRESSCQAEIMILDTTEPELDNCPAPLVFTVVNEETEADILAWVETLSGNDICSTVNYGDDIDPGIYSNLCNLPDTVRIEFTIADNCTNVTTCQSSLYIEPQATTISCPEPLTVECGDPTIGDQISTWEATTVAENQAGEEVTFESDFDLNSLDTNCGVSSDFEFWAIDACANRISCMTSIQLIDTTLPELNCPDAFVTTTTAEDKISQIETWLESITGTDNCDADLKFNHDFDETMVDLICGETTSITFNTTDECGNYNDCSVQLTIENNRELALSCPDSLTVRCGDPLVDQLIDDFLGMAEVTAVGEIQFTNDYNSDQIERDCDVIQVIEVGYSATDLCTKQENCQTVITLLPDPQLYLTNMLSIEKEIESAFTVYGNTSIKRIIELRVYNRWGNLIWDGSNSTINEESTGWDGRLENGQIELGVYTFVLAVEDAFGGTIEKAGSITVIK